MGWFCLLYVMGN